MNFMESAEAKLEKLKDQWQDELNEHQREVRQNIYDPTISSAVSIALDITSFNEKVEEYGIKYESLLSRTNDKAKSYLGSDSETDYELKSWMVSFCDDLFEGIDELQTTYSFNGSVDADVHAVRFNASPASKAIKVWWEDELEDDPYRLDYEKKLKKETEKREKEFEEERSIRDKEDLEEYNDLMRIFEEQGPIIQKKIDDEIDKGTKEFDEKCNDEIELIQSQYMPQIEKKTLDISKKKEEVASLSKELDSLGFFKKATKKELTDRIDAINSEIQLLVSECSNLNELKVREIYIKKKEYEDKKQRLVEKVLKDNPMPINPDKTLHRFHMASCETVYAYKEFNWKKYGVDPSKMIDENMSNRCEFNLDINSDCNWYMTSKERKDFLKEFVRFNEDNDIGAFYDSDTYLSFFLETVTYKGVEISYSIKNGELTTIIIPEDEKYEVYKKSYISVYSDLSFRDRLDLLKKYGELDEEYVDYIKDGYAL